MTESRKLTTAHPTNPLEEPNPRVAPEFRRDPDTTWNLSEVLQVLDEAHEYFDNKADAEIDSEGVHPNREMFHARRTKHASEYIEWLQKKLKGLYA